MAEVPSVSVVIPARNDAQHLEASVDAVLAQTTGSAFDVVIAVGPSEDRTAAVAADLADRHPAVRVIDNPTGTTAAGLNAAISVSRGHYVVRVDAHCEIEPDYVAGAVATLDATGADVVGGVQRAEGTTLMSQAIAAAMTSRFGAGDARYRYGGESGPTDTVYLGVFRRSALERVGGFDEAMLRNQDYELNWRIRSSGGVVWFDNRLSTVYRPRSELQALARQYFAYGRWKQAMLRRHPSSLRWRQLVPPAAVLAQLFALAAIVRGRRRAAIVPVGYAITALTVAGRLPTSTVRTAAAFAAMHHAWGVGFLLGARRPGSRDRGRGR